MISMACSKVHLRLVKKLPGQPPAGAIVPSAGAAGALPNVMTQLPPPASERFHLPVRSTGGGGGRGGGGGSSGRRRIRLAAAETVSAGAGGERHQQERGGDKTCRRCA